MLAIDMNGFFLSFHPFEKNLLQSRFVNADGASQGQCQRLFRLPEFLFAAETSHHLLQMEDDSANDPFRVISGTMRARGPSTPG
jgi:hypothetical protein